MSPDNLAKTAIDLGIQRIKSLKTNRFRGLVSMPQKQPTFVIDNSKITPLGKDTFISTNTSLALLQKRLSTAGSTTTKAIDAFINDEIKSQADNSKAIANHIKIHWKSMETALDEAILKSSKNNKVTLAEMKNKIFEETSNNFMAVTDDMLIESGFKPQLKTVDPLITQIMTTSELQKATFEENLQIIDGIIKKTII